MGPGFLFLYWLEGIYVKYRLALSFFELITFYCAGPTTLSSFGRLILTIALLRSFVEVFKEAQALDLDLQLMRLFLLYLVFWFLNAVVELVFGALVRGIAVRRDLFSQTKEAGN